MIHLCRCAYLSLLALSLLALFLSLSLASLHIRLRGKWPSKPPILKRARIHTQVSEEVMVEYVREQPEFEQGFEDEFRKIFDKFNFRESVASEEDGKKDESKEKADVKKKIDSDSDPDEEEQDNHQNEKVISNKKKKLQRRMNIAELKQVSARPDVVDVWDATSADPKLVVFLKSYRNTVPVPRHWSQKRKYLQGKRGIEKRPFQLPDFIAATGVEKIRQAYIEKEDGKKLKQKQRERMQPKMGKMDIDYQVLHDAFFKYQTKPKLTFLGELYFEGKEFEYGCPLYGDVFGVQQQDQPNYEEEPIDKSKHWGDLEEEEEEEEKEVEEQEEEMDEEDMEDGIESVDTLSSTPTGIETPDAIELRKEQRKEPDRPLYQVLEEKSENIAPGTLLGTSRTYVINTCPQDKAGAKRVDLLRGQRTDRVDVSLQPEEHEAMDNVLPAKYEEAREEEKQRRSQREDFSDMVAVAKNEKKRKRKMHRRRRNGLL